AERTIPQQIVNCDETCLFWKKMPKRTFFTQEEKTLPEYKPMKDSLTLLLCEEESKDYVEAERTIPQQVFNCDETGLFWKKMPKSTFFTQEEKTLPEHKRMKDGLNLLLCEEESKDYVEAEIYIPQQIFNCDETGHF
ncbi:hypothetical protein AVEN_89858-1, partial [Araneus ventricosus]